MGLLIQFHTLIVLFLWWLVGVDKVVEPDDEMKSLTSDVNGLEGEPLQSSACPKDIAGLNVARQMPFLIDCRARWPGGLVHRCENVGRFEPM